MSNTAFIYDVYIMTTPEKLWRGLTETEYTEQYFFGTSIKSNWNVGSEVTYVREGEVTDYGKILICEPFKTLSSTWTYVKDTNERAEPTVVTFILKEMGDMVKLSLKHEKLLPFDLNENPDTFEGFNNGWPFVLSSLKSLLGTGRALPAVL